MFAKYALLLFALPALAGCVNSGQRTSVTVGYYDVKGTTFKQLDQQIALHGPTVPGVGKAVASTNIRMVPNFKFRETPNGCVVAKANIKVIANVTLPRLSDRRKASQKLRPAFLNIERYARDHEAVHVAIADEYAQKAETAILNLPSEPGCTNLKKKAGVKFKIKMAEHRAAQLKFDADENKRFARLRASDNS